MLVTVRFLSSASQARGDANVESDLDLLVVKDEVGATSAEAARIYRALAGLSVPVDIAVARSDYVRRHADLTGYWFSDSAPDWTPPPALMEFLQGDPLPVCALGLGVWAIANQKQLPISSYKLLPELSSVPSCWPAGVVCAEETVHPNHQA